MVLLMGETPPSKGPDEGMHLLMHLQVKTLRVIGLCFVFFVPPLMPGALTPLDASQPAWLTTLFATLVVVGPLIGAASAYVARPARPYPDRVAAAGMACAVWNAAMTSVGLMYLGPTLGIGVGMAVSLMLGAAYVGRRLLVALCLMFPLAGVVAASLDTVAHPPMFWARITFVASAGGIVLASMMSYLLTSMRDALAQAESALAHEKVAHHQWQHAQQELQRAQRHEAIAKLAGGVAHDVNNALVVVQGGAGMLQESQLNADDRELVDDILTAAESTARTVQGLLMVARETHGEDETTHLATVLRHLTRAATRALPPNVSLTCDPVDDDVHVALGRGPLEQVLLNLVFNARDAMPDGGAIAVRPFVDGSCCVIDVDDDGSGIPEDVIDRMFEPYFTTKDVVKGSGLGLASALGLAEGAGGTLIASNTERGARLRLKLPTVAPSTAKPVLRDVKTPPDAA